MDFSGSLSTLRKLDRETSAQFSLQITAEDGGGKVSNDRWITRRLFKDEMLKVRGVSPPFELHLVWFLRFVFVQPLDNNQIYEECYKQEIYRVNLNKKIVFHFNFEVVSIGLFD